MPVQSPIHSFVDFENRISSVLPAYHSQLSFQFLFSSDIDVPRTGDVQIYIGNGNGSAALFLWNAAVYDVCFWGKILNINPSTDFPIVVGSDQIVPAATYTNFDDLLTALQAVGFNANAQTFLQCCAEDLQDYSVAFTAHDATSKTFNINFCRGLIYVDGSNNEQEADFESNNIKIGQCYTIAIGGQQSDDVHIVSQTEGATSNYTVVFDGTLRNADQIGFSLTDGTGNLNFAEIAGSSTTLDLLLDAVEAELTLTGFPYTRDGYSLHIQPRTGTLTAVTTVTVANPTISISAFSNTFKRVSNTHHLTFLTYSNNEDTYDFHYPADYLVNRLWFPFYFSKPAYPTARKIYRKSNKQYKVLSATIEKQFSCTTDAFTDEIHDRLVVALEHDNKHVYATGTYDIDQDIFMNSDYAIAWPDRDYPNATVEAPATFKVLQVFAGRNSNCEKRPVCIGLPAPPACVAVTLPEVTLPNASVGNVYNETITLSGTAPFTLSSIVKPSWLTVTLSGNVITLAGTPTSDDVGADITVSFTVTNCTDQTDSFYQTMDVVTHHDLSVTLTGDGDVLTAFIDDSVTFPAVFHFFCTTTGACHSFTIDDPNQTLSGFTATTPYSFVDYTGSGYNFQCTVTDADGNTGTSNSYTETPCLVPETKILLRDLTEKRIDELVRGELLFDSIVTGIQKRKVDKLFIINNGLLKCSAKHVHILDNDNLVQSDKLKIGDNLKDKFELPIEIHSIQIEDGWFDVVTISTDTKTYIANSIITHNKLTC